MSASRPTRTPSGASRREAARRKQQQQRRRRTAFVVVGGVAIVVVIALLIATMVGGSSSGQTIPTGQAAADIVQTVTSVPLSTAAPIGSGSVTARPKKLTGAPLTQDGKPEVLFIGAEYCPFCATERWAMVVALSRFGTFSNLAFTESTGNDVYPNTPTFTFRDATYTSPYIDFAAVETADRSGNPLQTPTSDQAATWQALDPNRTIPFVDIGGAYLINGATFDPAVLQGKSARQIADALGDPNSATAKGVLGAANDITAAICTTTNNQPADVCNAAPIKAIQDQLD